MKKEKKVAEKKGWLERINASYLLWGGVAFILLGPFALTYIPSFIDFRNTGQIGDTIGGITAPIISLIGAILVYKSFQAQLKANKKLNKQIKSDKKDTNFSFLMSEFEKQIVHFTKLEYKRFGEEKVEYGKQGFSKFIEDFIYISQECKKENLNKDESFIKKAFNVNSKTFEYSMFFLKFELFIEESKNLKLTKAQRPLLQSRIVLFYSEALRYNFEEFIKEEIDQLLHLQIFYPFIVGEIMQDRCKRIKAEIDAIKEGLPEYSKSIVG